MKHTKTHLKPFKSRFWLSSIYMRNRCTVTISSDGNVLVSWKIQMQMFLKSNLVLDADTQTTLTDMSRKCKYNIFIHYSIEGSLTFNKMVSRVDQQPPDIHNNLLKSFKSHSGASSTGWVFMLKNTGSNGRSEFTFCWFTKIHIPLHTRLYNIWHNFFHLAQLEKKKQASGRLTGYKSSSHIMSRYGGGCRWHLQTIIKTARAPRAGGPLHQRVIGWQSQSASLA